MEGVEGRFLTGSTMSHVVRMTLTGAMGITFVFLVDAANLFWVSRLGDERLLAALGFGWTIQFFSVSFGIGMMIAATALVARAIGEGDRARARDLAMASLVLSCATQLVVTLCVLLFRHQLVALTGAEGETARLAARYLAISVPSLPIMIIGMICGSVLRAEGDGHRAMYITLTSGSFAMFADPILILWLGLGLDGAALAVVSSRVALASAGLYFATRTYDLIAWPNFRVALRCAPSFFAISLPAVLTQLSPPFGNFVVTALIAGYGDGAVAGWAVVARLMVVAFGGIFSLASAIGGIFAQNFGAGLHDRVRTTYRDALVFCGAYVAVTWALLAAFGGPVARSFALGPEGAEVLLAFTRLSAGGFVFVGALFVANAAFNNLGRPVVATGLSWLRDGVVLYPAAALCALGWAAPGVMYGHGLAGVVVGIFGAWLGWRFVDAKCRDHARVHVT